MKAPGKGSAPKSKPALPVKSQAPAKPEPETLKRRKASFVLDWRWKTIGLIMATTFSLIGSLGQYLAVDNWNAQATEISGEINASAERVVTLRDAQSNYFSSYSEANILLGLNDSGASTAEGAKLTPLLFKMSLIHRARPIRQILAEMEAVGAANYKTAMEKYNGLASAVQTDFSRENYGALMEFEQAIVEGATRVENDLRERNLDLQQKKSIIENIRDTRRYWFTILMALGTVLLLAANLLADIKPKRAP